MFYSPVSCMYGTSLRGRSLQYINFLDRTMTKMLGLKTNNKPKVSKACFENLRPNMVDFDFRSANVRFDFLCSDVFGVDRAMRYWKESQKSCNAT